MRRPVLKGLNNLDDLFRLCHLNVMGYDRAPSHRARDIAGFHVSGKPPNYVDAYLKKYEIFPREK